MGCRPSRQNKRETTLESPQNSRRDQSSNPGTAQGLNQVPKNTSYLGNSKRGEGEEGEECLTIYDRTNYHIWSLFSRPRDHDGRDHDGLLQLDPSRNNLVLCNGDFSDKTGKSKCSYCFPQFLYCLV